MCIVVDTNSMASVFKATSSDHEEFKPVKDWIIEGKGKLVIGGSDYLREISSYIAIITELSKANKVIRLNLEDIDSETSILKDKIEHKNYDDPHIIALLSISRCRLICSKDSRAYPYFKNGNLYKNRKAPLIYKSSRNKNLLCDRNISEVCLPCIKLKKETVNNINL